MKSTKIVEIFMLLQLRKNIQEISTEQKKKKGLKTLVFNCHQKISSFYYFLHICFLQSSIYLSFSDDEESSDFKNGLFISFFSFNFDFFFLSLV